MPKRKIGKSRLPLKQEAAVLAAIKEVLKHPRRLTREETIEFISRRVYLGPPEPVACRERVKLRDGSPVQVPPSMVEALCPPGERLGKARGPHMQRTQYDDAYRRRRGLYQRLVRLPAESRKGTEKRRAVSARTRSIIESIARKLLQKSTPRTHLVREIARELDKRGKPAFHDSTIRRVLKEMEAELK